MSLNKRLYTSGQTTITSQNLNDIQDSIIELENKEVQQGVTSFNGQTGDIKLDALLFTKQDILADQKRQVKENLEIPDFFIINLSSDSDRDFTVDKTFDEIMSNIKAGAAVFLFNDGSVSPLTSYNEKTISFIANDTNYIIRIDIYANSITLEILGNVVTDENGVIQNAYKMANDPTEDMCIATKHYVDSHAGGSASAIVTITGSGTEEDPYIASHSPSEILAIAQTVGVFPFLVDGQLIYCYSSGSTETAYFQSFIQDFGISVMIDKNKKITYTEFYSPSFIEITGDGTEESPFVSNYTYNQIKSRGAKAFPFLSYNMHIFYLYRSDNTDFIYERVTDSGVYYFTINYTGTITLSTKLIKTSALENDAGYLTSHQSLSEYSKTTEVEALIDQKISALPKFYSGTAAPESSLGNDGDLYLQKVEE